eukprot:GEMP01030503.1.p1 GENE.GEMP01030503.1~~GEMP01030503.1.p1  ORF type:complete len:365 (+),score=72.63 GEMP01030503.1:114-1208(+)
MVARAAEKASLRCVEFFAGIGGLHAAADVARAPIEVVRAFEISDQCRKAYRANFSTVCDHKTIERLSVDEVSCFDAQVWLLSPPCQPFTRSGKYQDSQDPRTLPFLKLIGIFGAMQNPPKYLFIENVLGFEKSETRKILIEAMEKRKYECAEYSLSPTDVGIPNQRPRYYGLFRQADPRHASKSFHPGAAEPVWASWHRTTEPRRLREFLDETHDDDEDLEIAQDVMEKWVIEDKGRYDLHTYDDATSACFSKGYGRFPRGYGPLILMGSDSAEPPEKRLKVNGAEHFNVWRKGMRIRYVAPTEALSLMCFPPEYRLPKMGLRESLGLIGNSLNVRVVSELLDVLLETVDEEEGTEGNGCSRDK